jgi:hypothetical protein
MYPADPVDHRMANVLLREEPEEEEEEEEEDEDEKPDDEEEDENEEDGDGYSVHAVLACSA